MTGSALGLAAALLGAGEGAPVALARQLDAVAWDALLGEAGRRDLMPALWRPARTLGLVEPVPEPLVEALGDRGTPRHHPAAVLELAYRRNAARTQDLLDQLESVLADFAALGIEVVALKGAAHLVAGTWPDPAERAMSDLDLLVDPGAGRTAHRHLAGIGYVASEHPGQARGGHHHLPGLRHPDRFGSIELHVEPLQRGWRAALDAAELWAGARVLSWRGHRIGVPSPVDTAVISLVHGYLADLARYQAEVPLRMVHELWRFDRRVGPVDWPEVRDRLDAIGWASLVDDHQVTVGVLFGDQVARGEPGSTPRARAAARARLGFALALPERRGAARMVAPWLRARSSLDEGRLRRHYGTTIPGGWTLRRHHLSRQLSRRLPGRWRSPDPTRSTRPRALLVVPELPSPTDNGLAMRADTALRAVTAVADVTMVVIGRPGPSAPAEAGALSNGVAATRRRPPLGAPVDRQRAALESHLEQLVERLIVYRPEAVDDRDAARSWLADADSRTRLGALEPLSASTRLAHPAAVASLVAELAELVDAPDDLDPSPGLGRAHHGAASPFDLVHVVRLRMAPWAEPFAFRPGVVTVLDLDDDEVATHTRLAATARRRGELDLAAALAGEAEALGRMADWYVPRATALTVASPADVAGVARHQPRQVEVVPNAISPGRPTARSPFVELIGTRAGGPVWLLLVGNFTYAPNRWAAETLVDQIRPALAVRLGRTVRVHLVGAAPPSLDRLGAVEGVTLAGHVSPRELAAAYHSATLAVLALPPAGGTRIKVLEAFSHGLPLVATPHAVEGLGVVDGLHALVAEGVDALGDACVAALADPTATRVRAEQAWKLASGFDRTIVARHLEDRCVQWLRVEHAITRG